MFLRIRRLTSLVALFGCVLAAHDLGAQAASSNGPSQAGTSGQSTAASGAKAHDDSFVIGNDDVLAINVWKEPDISRSIPVRSDGKISLPLVGEVQAAGTTPLKLEQEIAGKLKSYISDPEVTVIVQQINSQKFNILGQGSQAWVVSDDQFAPPCWTRLRSRAAFGILRKRNRSTSCGRTPTEHKPKLPFNYKEVVKGQNLDAERETAAARHHRRSVNGEAVSPCATFSTNRRWPLLGICILGGVPAWSQSDSAPLARLRSRQW